MISFYLFCGERNGGRRDEVSERMWRGKTIFFFFLLTKGKATNRIFSPSLPPCDALSYPVELYYYCFV